jgi:hypothetical protein
MEHECGACDGSGVCQNAFHDGNVVQDLFTDAMGETCPA